MFWYVTLNQTIEYFNLLAKFNLTGIKQGDSKFVSRHQEILPKCNSKKKNWKILMHVDFP
jgi:hypothetical protein